MFQILHRDLINLIVIFNADCPAAGPAAQQEAYTAFSASIIYERVFLRNIAPFSKAEKNRICSGFVRKMVIVFMQIVPSHGADIQIFVPTVIVHISPLF